ncbi:snRNA-activating protein complex subunit [Linum perenne]
MDVESAVESAQDNYDDEVAEDEEEDVEQADVSPLLIARGGPLYTPNLVSPLIRVPEFQDAVLSVLQSLKDELDFDSSEIYNQDDIRVDDIKIRSNEELVEMALKEVFKEEMEVPRSPLSQIRIMGKCMYITFSLISLLLIRVGGGLSTSSKMHTRSRSFQRKGGASATPESVDCADSETKSATNSNTRSGKKSRKRKRYILKGVDESYPAIVDDLLNIKKKQDEDKAAANLHSLSSGCKVNKGSIVSESGTIMKSLRSVNSNMQLVKTSDIMQEVPVQLPEVVLVVEVYHNVHQWQKTQEFLVLGRQVLTELKDKIYCKTDEMMKRAEHYDASGYFLIEDLFCNDLRAPYSTDYSEPIFDWLKNSKEEVDKKWEFIISGDQKRKLKALVGVMPTLSLPGFQRAQMQTVRFCDLKFQLGAPYLYCHQGGCKHTMVIRDMRLIHPDDSQNRAAYPIVSFRLKVRMQKCSMCNIFRAKKVTVDDKLAKHNPCYFCNDCYYLLHYSGDRTLLYDDFSVYDYLDYD